MKNKRAASTRGAGALGRRQVVIGSAAVVTAAILPSSSDANVPVPYGNSVSFVPFTKLEGDVIKGTHRAN
jgi:hypothetical protein